MKIFLGIIVYAAVTFPYAMLWHMKIFKKKYKRWGYFGTDPKPVIGLLAILTQGVVLSYVYSILEISHQLIHVGLLYAFTMGLFFWSSHVLAAMAKSKEIRNMEFLFLESVYLLGQFGTYGVLIALMYQFF